MRSLLKATSNSQKGRYSKGQHSFELLASLDAIKITDNSPWAKRLVEFLKELMHGLVVKDIVDNWVPKKR
jgi:hypothetical protein